MEKNELISIIVPIYNVEEYLDRCVDSIVNQTYTNLEIILVDDGSPDNCPQMCDDWVKKDNRIKVIHKENGGVSSARNVGLDSATGKYIGFCDPDDIMNNCMIEYMYESLKKGDTDCCICSFESFSEYIDKDELTQENVVKKIFKDEGIFEYLFEKQNKLLGSVWNKLFKVSLLYGKNFDESLSFGEDYVFTFEFLLKCNSVSIIESPNLYYYCVRENSATKTIDSNQYYSLFFQKKRLYEECIKKFQKDEIKRIFETAYVNMLKDTYLNVNDGDAELIKKFAKKSLIKVLFSSQIYWKEKIFFVLKVLFCK